MFRNQKAAIATPNATISAWMNAEDRHPVPVEFWIMLQATGLSWAAATTERTAGRRAIATVLGSTIQGLSMTANREEPQNCKTIAMVW